MAMVDTSTEEAPPVSKVDYKFDSKTQFINTAYAFFNNTHSVGFMNMKDSMTKDPSKELKDGVAKIAEQMLLFSVGDDVTLATNHLASIMQKLQNIILLFSNEIETNSKICFGVIDDKYDKIWQEITGHIMAWQSLAVSYHTSSNLDISISDLISRCLVDNDQLNKIFSNLLFTDIEAGGFKIERSTTTPEMLGNNPALKRLINSIQYDFSSQKSGNAMLIYLAGPPGSGKTATCQALASVYSGGLYVELNMSSLSSSYIGETEHKLERLFKGASSNPKAQNITVIFNEADVIWLPNAAPHINSVAQTIQTLLDLPFYGGNILFLCTTNYYYRLPEAMRRRARITVYIQAPEFTTIRAEIERYLRTPCNQQIKNRFEKPNRVATQEYEDEVIKIFQEQTDTNTLILKNVADTISAAQSNYVGNTVFGESQPALKRGLNNSKACYIYGDPSSKYEESGEFKSLEDEPISEIENPLIKPKWPLFIFPSLEEIKTAIKAIPVLSTLSVQKTLEKTRNVAANILIM